MTRVNNELAPDLGYLSVNMFGERVQRLVLDHTREPFSGGPTNTKRTELEICNGSSPVMQFPNP